MTDNSMIPMPVKAKPYAHQYNAFEFACKKFGLLPSQSHSNGVALLMEMGTGKTLTSIAIAGALYQFGKVRKILVTAPLSILGVWEHEFSQFADFPHTVTVLTGSSRKKAETLNSLKDSELQIVIVNYESAWRIENELLAFDADLIIADEAHKLKEARTSQSKAMHRFGDRARYKLLLTGTVITNRELDVFSQYRFLNRNIFGDSFYVFRNRYFDMVGYGNHIPRFRNYMLGEFLEKMHSVAFRVTKAECLDLPEVTEEIRTVDLEDKAMAILIWLMIYPMMMKVDFQSIKNVGKNPKGLFVTWITNWLIKPFTMYGIASLFFFVVFKAFITPDLATEYLAGAVLLGAAPCTAMVFVWSSLTKGDPAYTVVQVATNDLIILVAFIPIVKFLLGVSNVSVPWDTLILSVVLFVVIPLAGGMLTRYLVTKKKGKDYLVNTFVKKFDGITTIGLLLTLIMIFSFQGNVILENPLHIVLIAVPLILQTFLIFAIAYGACKLLKLPHKIAAPAGMIGASNFFELAVAVAVALFGTTSPAALATTVGVLTEVPVMLFLVKVANSTKGWFKND